MPLLSPSPSLPIPVHEPEEKGSRAAAIPAPEQCLIGNRATNNYPYARIRTAHARCAIGLSWHGADCWPGYTAGDKNRYAATNDD